MNRIIGLGGPSEYWNGMLVFLQIKEEHYLRICVEVFVAFLHR
jgi:hypothetical protein